MTIDQYSVLLLEEAKRFIEKYDDPDSGRPSAYLHASLVLAMCSLEAHINAIADDLTVMQDLSPWEKSILLERGVDLKDGEFVLMDGLKMQRLEDRILFICRRFSKNPLDRNSPMWGRLKDAVRLRNSLVHPKEVVELNRDQVTRAIEAVLLILDHMFSTLYKQGFPQAKRGLQSSVSF